MEKRRTTDEIEGYFGRYPDVPREVILKEDVLTQGLSFTDAALAIGQSFRVKSYRLFSYDRVRMEELARQESVKVPEELFVKGGQYQLRRTSIQTRISPSSPYVVDASDGQLSLSLGGQKVAELEYPPAPKYYSKSFEDGTLYREVAPLTGNHILFVTVFRNCQLWGVKEECQFCDINVNARQMKQSRQFSLNAPTKKVEQVVEALATAFSEETDAEYRPLSYLMTGGAVSGKLGGMEGEEFYLRYVRAAKERLGNRWPCSLQTTAQDKKTLERYREAGVDCHQANIEVWDKRLFKIICPGKDRQVGRDEWIKRVVDSVDVFGEGNVCPNLVAGVEMSQPHGFKTVDEAVESTSEGLEFLMSHGVVPRLNHWCVEPGSTLGGSDPAPLDYYIRIMQAYRETWQKYNLPPGRGMGPVGIGRSFVSHGSYMDIAGA